jgi:pyruvate kinase
MTSITPAPPEIVRTKIVATLGPASRSEEVLRGLVEAGVDVFRLNMAHGSIPEHEESLGRIRRVSDELGRPVGVLADLAGPKIRLGELPGGSLECAAGATLRFVRGTEPRNPDELTTTYPPLVDELAVGDSVMLADGTISLVVEERNADWARCRVVQGGVVRSRQGVNLPGVKLSVAAMSRLAARRMGGRERDRLREPVVRPQCCRGEAAQGAAPHPGLRGSRRREDREAGGDRQSRLHRRCRRCGDGGPR